MSTFKSVDHREYSPDSEKRLGSLFDHVKVKADENSRVVVHGWFAPVIVVYRRAVLPVFNEDSGPRFLSSGSMKMIDALAIVILGR